MPLWRRTSRSERRWRNLLKMATSLQGCGLIEDSSKERTTEMGIMSRLRLGVGGEIIGSLCCLR